MYQSNNVPMFYCSNELIPHSFVCAGQVALMNESRISSFGRECGTSFTDLLMFEYNL